MNLIIDQTLDITIHYVESNATKIIFLTCQGDKESPPFKYEKI